MTLEGPRVMNKDVAAVSMATDETGITTTITGPAGYEKLTVGALEAAVYRDYFDLSGYTQADLTTFIQGVDIQEGCIPNTSVPPNATEHLTIYDLITTEFISDAEIRRTLLTAPASTFYHNQFGFPTSQLDQQQIIYGRMRVWSSPAAGVNVAFPQKIGDNVFGTGTATAGEKLYITRIAMNHTADSSVSIPPVNYVVATMVVKEKELPFLMRMKRSYELAT